MNETLVENKLKIHTETAFLPGWMSIQAPIFPSSSSGNICPGPNRCQGQSSLLMGIKNLPRSSEEPKIIQTSSFSQSENLEKYLPLLSMAMKTS